jgi:hypothetical protein
MIIKNRAGKKLYGKVSQDPLGTAVFSHALKKEIFL